MLQHDRKLTELFAEQCWIPVLLPRVLLGDEDPGRLEARQPGGGQGGSQGHWATTAHSNSINIQLFQIFSIQMIEKKDGCRVCGVEHPHFERGP